MRLPVAALAAVLLSAVGAHAQTDIAAIRATKTIEALRIDEPIVIDGEFSEPAWGRAQIGRDFYQQEPDAGAPTTEPSEIRFLYDADALYFAGTFYDSDPRGPIVDELKRDFEGRNGDIIGPEPRYLWRLTPPTTSTSTRPARYATRSRTRMGACSTPTGTSSGRLAPSDSRVDGASKR
jgi:hypothetical protein